MPPYQPIRAARSKVLALWLKRPLTSPHVVCWYGSLTPNLRARTVPLVRFVVRKIRRKRGAFHSLSSDGFGPSKLRALPAGVLGQHRLGSVLHGRSPADPYSKYPAPVRFNLDFSRIAWSLELASEVLARHHPLPIPWLQGVELDSWLIVFRREGGRSLLVPCVEFFSRCYGHSKELQRVLLTYPWYDVERRIFQPSEPPSGIGNGWYIRLGPKMVLADAVFLAHIRYDGFTQGSVKRIHASQEALKRGASSEFPLRVGPWFEGPGVLLVRGYELDENTFLAIRVEGSSEPVGGPTIYVETPERASTKDGTKDAGAARTSTRTSFLRKLLPPPLLKILGDTEPDSVTGHLRADDPDFTVLGSGRRLVRVVRKRDSERERSGTRLVQTAEELSPGEPRSTGEGVGQVIFEPVLRLESNGMLHDMWQALLELHKEHPAQITSVEWFTLTDGLHLGSPPQLIPFPVPRPASPLASIQGADARWRLIDPDAQPEDRVPRGLLVTRVEVEGRVLCIVDIERRQDGQKEKENFRGLVFRLGESDDLHALIPPIVQELPAVKGVFANMLPRCPAGAQVFRHNPGKNPRIPGESAVCSAFEKLGVTLPTGLDESER